MGVVANSTPGSSTTFKPTPASSSAPGDRDKHASMKPKQSGTPKGGRPEAQSPPRPDTPSSVSRVDAESETEVVSRLDRINSLAEQASLLTADWNTFRPQQSRGPVSAAYKKNLKSIVHPTIIDHLDGGSIADSSTRSLLRFAWEIIICRSVALVLAPFALVNPQKEYSLLKPAPKNKIAREADAQQKKNPAQYANWRSTRHKQLRTSIPDSSQKTKLQTLCQAASALCYSCACLLVQPSIPERLAFLKTLETSISRVLTASLELAIVIHEGILSQEFALYLPQTGTSVESSKVTLEEGLQVEAKSPVVVLGVTQVGISSTPPSSSAPKTPPPSPRYLRRAKVVSERVLAHLRTIGGQSQASAPQPIPVTKGRTAPPEQQTNRGPQGSSSVRPAPTQSSPAAPAQSTSAAPAPSTPAAPAQTTRPQTSRGPKGSSSVPPIPAPPTPAPRQRTQRPSILASLFCGSRAASRR